MRNLLKIVITVTGILSLFACVKVLDYDIPNDEKRIVVNGVLSNRDTFEVHINKSLHILDRLGLKAVNNALVQLYEDDILVSEINTGNAGLYVSGFTPEPGHDYLLKVSVPGMNTASARCTLPAPVLIEQVDTIMSEFEVEEYYYYEDTVMTVVKSIKTEMMSAITFSDPEKTENYYELECSFSYLSYGPVETEDSSDITGLRRIFSTLSLKSNDPLIEMCISGNHFIPSNQIDDHYYGNKILFSDQLINGQKYTLTIFTSPYFSSTVEYIDSVQVDIRLKSVTKDYYEYMQLLGRHLQVKGDPLSEPSQAFTNINDGLGILAGISESVFTININKPPKR